MNHEAWLILLTAATPVVELRGSIPLGLAMGLPIGTVWVLSIIGNLLPVPFILIGISWVLTWLKNIPIIHDKVNRLAEKGGAKLESNIQRWGWLGLLLFVAIPLPGTGAWTGALAATVLNLRFWPSLLSIVVGVTIASLLVSGIGIGVMNLI